MIRIRRPLPFRAGDDLVRPSGQVFPVFVLHLLVSEDVRRAQQEASDDAGHDLPVVVVDDEFAVLHGLETVVPAASMSADVWGKLKSADPSAI